MAVARSSSGIVAMRYVLPVDDIVFFFYNGLRRTNFAKIYLFTVKSDRLQFPIIKGHNFD